MAISLSEISPKSLGRPNRGGWWEILVLGVKHVGPAMDSGSAPAHQPVRSHAGRYLLMNWGHNPLKEQPTVKGLRTYSTKTVSVDWVKRPGLVGCRLATRLSRRAGTR